MTKHGKERPAGVGAVSASGEAAKAALEAATVALADEFGFVLGSPTEVYTPDYWHRITRRVLAAHYDQLLGELPEEAVLAGVQRSFDRHITQPNDIQRENVIGTFQAMVRSLRDSLYGGG